MIPDAKIAEIRERADIVDVIGEYVTLKRAGVNYKGVCPFHADSDPSFNVNPARQFFHCFGCGASGDVFKFLMNLEGLQFMEAVERLAARYGVELPEREMSPAARTAQDRAREAAKRRLFILEEAASFFEEKLRSPEGEAAREALKARGIDGETAALFRLGYAPDEWQGLLDHLARQRVSPREAEQVGLVLQRKSGSGHYDRFRNRLVFTISDPGGHPIAFSARVIGDGEEQGAKYINSPETPEYTKGKVLYGLNQARVELSKTKEAILVEGNFDVVALAHGGIRNVVAPLGTALTEDHAALLRRRVERVTVMFDGDKAGRAAAARAFPVLARAGMAAYMAPLPEGQDPDSLIRSGGADAVRELVDRRRGLLDEIIEASAAAGDGSAQDVARRIGKLGPYVDAVRDSMERDVYRQRIADAFSLDPKLVFRHLRGRGRETEAREPAARSAEESSGSVEEKELVGLLLDLPALCEEASDNGTIAMVTDPALKRIAEELVFRNRSKDSDISEMIASASEEPATRWLARRGMTRLFDDEAKGREALREIAARLNRRSIDNRIKELNHRIKLANSRGDSGAVFELQRERTGLKKELTQAESAFDKERFGD